jgi:cell division protein ZapA
MKMSEVEINVGGRKYAIACNPGEETDVLAASEELNKEAKNMINAIGKVSDVKLLLMAGLMVSGRLKTIENELITKNKEILEINSASSTLKDQIQELTNSNYEIQKKEKLDITKSRIDETSVTKILGSILEKLKTLVEKDDVDLEENKKRVDNNEKQDLETDQQELF